MHGTTAIIIIFEIKIPRYIHRAHYSRYTHHSQSNPIQFDSIRYTTQHVPFEYWNNNQAKFCSRSILVFIRFTWMLCGGTPSLAGTRNYFSIVRSFDFVSNYQHLPNNFLSIHPEKNALFSINSMLISVCFFFSSINVFHIHTKNVHSKW